MFSQKQRHRKSQLWQILKQLFPSLKSKQNMTYNLVNTNIKKNNYYMINKINYNRSCHQSHNKRHNHRHHQKLSSNQNGIWPGLMGTSPSVNGALQAVQFGTWLPKTINFSRLWTWIQGNNSSCLFPSKTSLVLGW